MNTSWKWGFFGLAGLFLVGFYWTFVHTRVDLYHPIKNNWIPQTSTPASSAQDYEDGINETYRRRTMELSRRVNRGEITSEQAKAEAERLLKEYNNGKDVATRLRGSSPVSQETPAQITPNSLTIDEARRYTYPANCPTCTGLPRLPTPETTERMDGEVHVVTISGTEPVFTIRGLAAGTTMEVLEMSGYLYLHPQDKFYIRPVGAFPPSSMNPGSRPGEYTAQNIPIGAIMIYLNDASPVAVEAPHTYQTERDHALLRVNMRSNDRAAKDATGSYEVRYRLRKTSVSETGLASIHRVRCEPQYQICFEAKIKPEAGWVNTKIPVISNTQVFFYSKNTSGTSYAPVLATCRSSTYAPRITDGYWKFTDMLSMVGGEVGLVHFDVDLREYLFVKVLDTATEPYALVAIRINDLEGSQTYSNELLNKRQQSRIWRDQELSGVVTDNMIIHTTPPSGN